uniref:N(4)-(Beta-N-acetylglucosaminyl)-L-asparaginase n=1 Tax=Plectus sambesii TaxID=2011161 RepID=A0A914UNL4_9BILA
MAAISKFPWCLALWCSVSHAFASARSTKDDTEPIPIVVTTWANQGFVAATDRAWRHLQTTGDRLGAVVEGCSACEEMQCDRSVGYGGSPDESGETTVEALLMDGPRHRMGAVGDLRRVKSASRVAYAVMNYTKHSLIVGESATKFAIEMGFTEESLQTDESKKMY